MVALWIFVRVEAALSHRYDLTQDLEEFLLRQDSRWTLETKPVAMLSCECFGKSITLLVHIYKIT